ncbi:MAG: aldehyde ferredoxin oxidoreductase family protein [Promethearchaeota archaeon]
MSLGYFGKILWVDLSKESINEKSISEKEIRQFLGGYGLGCKIIYNNTKAKYDPLSTDAILGIFPGLLTGTAAPFSGRYMVCGKSPLTGTWGDANGGGTFGPEIKKCGYDGIAIKGKSDAPKYLAIIDGSAELLDAGDIWGLDIIKTEEKLREKYGKFAKVAAIGNAGEKLSLISGIANDKGRIAARSGLGAVMGSKKLKALVLKGKSKIEFADRKKFMEYVKNYNKKKSPRQPGFLEKRLLNTVPKLAKTMRRLGMGITGTAMIYREIYHNLGTSVGNTILAETGDTPIKNWGGIGIFDFPYKKSKEIGAHKINSYKIREFGCFSCPVQCGGILKVPEADLEETHLPEYETCAAFGALILNNDLISIFKINEMCNRAAIDTISTGGTVAFAIECYENGILTKEDTDGLELTWGNSAAIIELVKKIINREGIGDILADGTRRAAEKIGKGSEKFAIHSLGQEVAMHNPRVMPSLALTYAFDPTPGRHTAASVDFAESGPINKYIKGFKLPKGWKKDDKKKAVAQKLIAGLQQLISCSGLCMFSSLFGPYPMVELIKTLTGWDVSTDELIETGIRIQTLRQAFTIREGIEIAKNELPGRVYGEPPDEKGPNKGITIEYKEFYKNYCEAIGWNPENGYPLKDTLKNLDLEFVIKDLY